MPKPKEIAAAIANSLKSELQLPVDARTGDITRMANTLWLEPPPRSKMSFQTKTTDTEGLDATPKQVFAPEISDHDSHQQELFCMSHGGFHLIPSVDIEHATPYAEIRDRQKVLLDYLNDSSNSAVATELLKIPPMDRFFGRLPTPKKIKDKDLKVERNAANKGRIVGSSYFYKSSYNSVDNLWLLCHACNIKKSDKDSLKWFKEQSKYFGVPFVRAIKKEGGLDPGILIDVVGGFFDEKMDDAVLPFNIIQGATGFGSFIRTWFHKERADVLKIHRTFHSTLEKELKSNLEDFANLIDDKNYGEAEKLRERMTSTLSMTHSFSEGYKEAAAAHFPSPSIVGTTPGKSRPKFSSNVGLSPSTASLAKASVRNFGRISARKEVKLFEIKGALVSSFSKGDEVWGKTKAKMVDIKTDVSMLEDVQKFIGASAKSSSPPIKTEALIEGILERLMPPDVKLVSALVQVDKLELESKSQHSAGQDQRGKLKKLLAEEKKKNSLLTEENTDLKKRNERWRTKYQTLQEKHEKLLEKDAESSKTTVKTKLKNEF